jgi:hypothetical protein
MLTKNLTLFLNAMKKNNLLIIFLACTFATFAQTYTTGTVSLSTTAGLAMSVKIDVGTNVTLTLGGPADRWFAVGFNASSMAVGTDVVGVHSSGTLTNFDASLSGYAAPVTDAQQNWTISSNQVNAGVRTIIATRAINTGDAADYVFTAGPGSLSLIWARGATPSSYLYAYHGSSNRGITNVTFSLMPSPPPLTVTPTNTTICAGASTTLTASSSQGAAFLWSPGGATTASVTVSPTTTTTYTCVATLNGVSSTATSVVNVLAVPVVNQVSSTAYCDNQYVPPTVFSGTAGATYSWTNSNTLNGVQASGTVNVPGYIATVLSNSLETGNIIVTPSLNGCDGTPMTFSISLIPTPSALQFDWDWCHGQTATPITILGNYTSVQWTNSNTSIGQVASGSGVLPAFTAINTGTSAIISVVTVTSYYTFGGTTCTSNVPPFTFEYRIYPVGTINPNPNINVCSGSVIPAVNFTGNTTQFEWTNSNPAIGLPSTGIGNISSYTAPTVSSITTATIIVTPRYFTSSNFYCDGVADTFLITIYPQLTSQTFITSCSPVTWNGNTYLSSGNYSVNLTSVYGCDSTATLVLTDGATILGGESVTACNSYAWNGATYTASGSYTAMLTAANGCDSLATLTLTINSGPQTPLVNVINTADYVELSTPSQANASYQWVNCPNYNAIAGEDSSIFIVTTNGNYAVIVTNACGADTSSCSPIATIGLEENNSIVELFPTILQSTAYLTLSADHWAVYDSYGKRLRSISPDETQVQFNYPAGIYVLANSKRKFRIVVY